MSLPFRHPLGESSDVWMFPQGFERVVSSTELFVRNELVHCVMAVIAKIDAASSLGAIISLPEPFAAVQRARDQMMKRHIRFTFTQGAATGGFLTHGV